MLGPLIFAAALMQPNIVAVLGDPAPTMNRAELIERPTALAGEAFVEQLIQGDGAAGWERMAGVVEVDGFQLRMVALRHGADGLMFFIPLDDEVRTVCRVRRTVPGVTPQAERDRIDRFCLRGIGRPD